MVISTCFRGALLSSLLIFCFAHVGFCGEKSTGEIIAKVVDSTATVEAPPPQVAREIDPPAQPKHDTVSTIMVPAASDTSLLPESQMGTSATASPPPDYSAASSGEQGSRSKITPPLSISLSPSDKTATKAIERSFALYTNNLKKRFSVWLERSARYLEVMKDILKDKNMPEELVFLPIVESGFNPKAYSSARAAGPWQFIAGTAKRYGLVIDWWRDERKDPVKSTVAAADYLKDLYGMFGSWSLALAAYNAGEGRIAKALRRTDSDNLWSLLDTKQIRQETKDYVPHYIAATIIANTPENYGFSDLSYHEPFEYDEVVVYTPVDLEVIAKCAGTGVDEIRELNPELRRWSTPPNMTEYTLRLPVGTADAFIENLSSMPDDKLFSYDSYTVKKNETLKRIAARTGVPVSTILAMNSLAGIERLHAGETIKLPPQGQHFADIDDKMMARKVSLKSTNKGQKAKKGVKSKSTKASHGKSKSKVKTKKT
jgi:membrane-bound lytic murein transglycosylase D